MADTGRKRGVEGRMASLPPSLKMSKWGSCGFKAEMGSRKKPVSCSIPEVHELQEDTHAAGWVDSEMVLVPEETQVMKQKARGTLRRDL